MAPSTPQSKRDECLARIASIVNALFCCETRVVYSTAALLKCKLTVIALFCSCLATPFDSLMHPFIKLVSQKSLLKLLHGIVWSEISM